jgi:hypothetical protein
MNRQQMVIGRVRMTSKAALRRRFGMAVAVPAVAPMAFVVIAMLSAASLASAMADESEHATVSEHAVLPSPAPSPGAGPETVKYYVVGPPKEGQREFLFEIAAKTLGDGLRYLEIFELNLGRPQPDGRRLVNPTLIESGWILLLPPDASGPSVRTGPLPQPRRSLAPDAATTNPGSEISQGGLRSRPPLALRLGAMLAVAGAVIAFTLRHSGPRIRRQTGLAAATTAEAPPGSVPVESTHAGVPERGGPPDPIAFTARVALGHDVVGVRLVGSSAIDAALVLPYGWGERASHVPQSASAPVCIGRDSAGFLFVDLARTPEVVTVTGNPDARARLAVSVVNQLLARRIRHRLGVTVVGDVIDRARLRRGSRFVPDVGELTMDGLTRGARCDFVICAVSREEDLDLLRHLVRASRRRVVPIVVGDLPPARWSFDVQ